MGVFVQPLLLYVPKYIYTQAHVHHNYYVYGNRLSIDMFTIVSINFDSNSYHLNDTCSIVT